jgi:RpiR family carbohydrate utilization transcriptional regulator
MPRQPRARAGATVQLRAGEVASKIQAARSGLVPSEIKVVELILNDPNGVLAASVSNVADRAGTAESTVIRACQRIGFKGFHDTKLALARDLAMQTRDAELERSATLGPGTSRGEIPGVILRESAASLQNALATLDTAAYEAAVSAIADAKRVLVIGNGTSGAPAADAAYRLATLGLVVQAPADAFGQHLAARALDDRDVLIAVSHTGATRETLLAVEAATVGGARLVAVTSYVRSPLTALAHHALVVGGHELGFRQEAMASRLAHLAVLDALFVGIAFARPKRAHDFLEVMAEVTADHTL